MKKRILLKCLLSSFICCIFIVGDVSCQAAKNNVVDQPQQLFTGPEDIAAPDKINTPEEIPTRQSILNQIATLKSKLKISPNDDEIKLTYAEKLFQLGDFPESKQVLSSISKKDKQNPDAIYLAAQIAYVTGNYNEAARLFSKLNQMSSKDYQTKAQTGLLYTYYQTNQFDKAHSLTADLEKNSNEPLKELMAAFGNVKPYQIEWNKVSGVTIPFIANEPLPAVSVEVNGKQINAIIDTGGDMFILDESMAASLGIKPVSYNIGTYAGGLSVKTGYGKMDSLSLSHITLKSVPVMIAPIKQFSEIYKDKIEINAILTTGVLKQFLSTMDYPKGQLILHPRNEQGKLFLKEYLSEHKEVDNIPFALGYSHFMTAKGSINGKNSLNFFVDSGLACDIPLILLEQTLKFTNIPMPTEKIRDNTGGLGGNDYEYGIVDVDSFCLGKLPYEKNIKADVGTLEPGFNFEKPRGFIMDGLISHHFLKQYSWTIDFDTMTMIFSQ